jgi:hypothetical protein
MLHWATGILLLAASVFAGMNSRDVPRARQTSGVARRWRLILALALALAAGWELLGLENWVGNLARAWARAEDVYFSREWFQRMSISAVIAAAIVVLGVAWHQRWPHRALLVCFGLYLAISLANLLSLHALDRYAGIRWHGVTLVDGLKFIAAAAVVTTTVYAGRRTRNRTVKTTE